MSLCGVGAGHTSYGKTGRLRTIHHVPEVRAVHQLQAVVTTAASVARARVSRIEQSFKMWMLNDGELSKQ